MTTPQRIFLPLISLLAALCWSTTTAAEMPETFKNEYRTRIMGFSITAVHELKSNSDGTQELHFSASTWLASLDEKTHFAWSDEGEVQPLNYSYRRRGLGRGRDHQLSFDWDEAEVSDGNGESWPIDTEQRLQDRLSFQVQLQKDLLQGKDTLFYQITDGGDLREYQFDIVGEERLDTTLGEVDTIKVRRSREGSDRTTNLWLAKDHNLLLVRLEQDEGGTSYTLNISKANVNGQAIRRF
ncbi:DUF3108 domain-containing protein [Marinimicrobium alkaliphilum]|uniref:DUF3108 domain-containing protein n=1 Tax=Marinimicrobium alkaliphilum TaxID=2202654 RepID=UPI000DB90BBB|nr:DUF3108 domain-containing protein [Marinimicrobium alkaliphilum]